MSTHPFVDATIRLIAMRAKQNALGLQNMLLECVLNKINNKIYFLLYQLTEENTFVRNKLLHERFNCCW